MRSYGIPTLEEEIQKEIVKVDAITEKKILHGFDAEVQGNTYHFSYKSDDQTNFAQMTNSVNLSLQLGSMTAEARTASFGSTLPVALPGEWRTQWYGHKDGKAVILTLTIGEFSALASAGGAHLQGKLAEGQAIKQQLYACTTKDELAAKVKELDIDAMQREVAAW